MELIHGGDWAGQEERLGNRSIRDFSANVSPLGVPDGVREAICRAAGKIDRYPDPLCRKLVQKLSEELSCPEEWIVCGNGAADLIYRLFQAEKPKKVLLTAPAFAEYEQAAGLVGSRIYFYELKEEDQFQIQEDILGQITPDTDLVFLCEPNNPTGQCTKHSLLTAILDLCPGNVLFGHAENEMGVNPFCLFVWQTGNRCVKFLHGHFPLIQFMGR